MNRKLALMCAVAWALAARGEVITVRETGTQTDERAGLTVVAGKVALPREGRWMADPVKDYGGIGQVFLRPGEVAQDQLQGKRARQVELQRQTEEGRYLIYNHYWMCERYANAHAGHGPDKWADIVTQKHERVQADAFFLVPGLNLSNAQKRVRGAAAPVLIVELKPAVDDGQYWVAFADGRVQRMAIDKDLVARHNLSIRPVKAALVAEVKDNCVEYEIFALRHPGGAKEARLLVTNVLSRRSQELIWPLEPAERGAGQMVTNWGKMRGTLWATINRHGGTPILDNWLDLTFGNNPEFRGTFGNRGEARGAQREREGGDAMSVLSGRAAVRETLQMQALRGGAGDRKLPLAQVSGVEVKSHPFEELLGGKPGGVLPLADAVPADRFFVYCAKPDALLPMLGAGADFAFRTGSAVLENNLSYDLKARYLARLGLSEEWLHRLMRLGAVKVMGLVLPDLFVIDGTDITVLARVPKIKLLSALLKVAGVSQLEAGGVQVNNAGGEPVFWALQGDLLLVSTSRTELDLTLALLKNNGAGSLGRSAEYRYMLTQLPVQPETRLHAYFSDAFLRRLVGPQLKIAQERRLQARVDLERIAAAGLLWRLDGQAGQPDLPALAAKHYVPEDFLKGDYTLDKAGVASSRQFGAPGRMQPLSAQNVGLISQAEADAYRQYLDNYAHFWRQYFDPIAMRLDDDAQGGLALTTFILPLVNNSIYDNLKQFIAAAAPQVALHVPRLEPAPVALFSLNLKDEAWVQTTRSLMEVLSATLGWSTEIFDQLGPSVHLAVQDGDPIVTIGGGDLGGLLGGMEFSGRNSEMLFIPVIASILTRPCDLFIEVKNPELVRAALARLPGLPPHQEQRWEPRAQYYRMAGRDAWVCLFDIEGFIKLRFGIEVMGRYLVLRNLPWSPHVRLAGDDAAALNGLRLEVFPETGERQQAGLFTAAAERERTANLNGMACLWPLLLTGCKDPAEAQQKHAALFGCAPEHPGVGRWQWRDGNLRSSVFGGFGDSCQPEYKPGDRPFGLLQGMEHLRLNLQFEDTGLRVIARWKLTDDKTRQ
jgi:hypothetical protein